MSRVAVERLALIVLTTSGGQSSSSNNSRIRRHQLVATIQSITQRQFQDIRHRTASRAYTNTTILSVTFTRVKPTQKSPTTAHLPRLRLPTRPVPQQLRPQARLQRASPAR